MATPRPEQGAPIQKGAIDPELIKLARSPSRIGVITSAGVVILCALFVWRLGGDRRFAANETPLTTTVADIAANKVLADRFVSIEIEPMMAHAIRAARNKTGIGFRVAPVRGSSEKLWVVMNGDGWDKPTTGAFQGRLEHLSELPFADVVGAYATAHPRPAFAKAAAVRAGFASNRVATVTGDTATLEDADKVAVDVVDPNAAQVIAVFNERLPDPGAWTTALDTAGIALGAPLVATAGPNSGIDQLRFEVKGADAVASTTKKLEAAELFAARVEPITRHYETTWATIKTSPPAGFTVAANTTLPEAELDLVGLYVGKGIPDGAYALITGDRPEQYWYVLPITIVLIFIGLVFAWTFVRAVRRDFLPTRAAEPTS